MAWKDTLLDASFRGVPFECDRIGRAGQRAIGQHEYPYVAGGELEDLNLVARRIRLRAYFFGDNYEDELAQFIDALEAPGTGDLVHPIHGSMTVLAEAWEDEHDAEFVDGATLNVSFIEDARRDPIFSGASTSAKADAIAVGADTSRAAADDALSRFLDGAAFDAPRVTALNDAFGQVKGYVNRLLSITGSAGLLLSDLDPLVYPRAYAADLLASVDRAFQGLPFGDRNSTYGGPAVPLTAVSAVGDFNLLKDNLGPAGLTIVPSVVAQTDVMLADAAVVQAHARVHCATAIAEAAAIVLAGEADVPVLTRSDIEQLTGQTRAAIQLAIDGARGALDAESRGVASAALAALAWKVQEAARAVINLRPPLVQRASPVSGPVRLVAHAMYGSPDRAPELSALNQLGRRVLVDKGEALYAYAR